LNVFPELELNTFSVVARCSRTGQLGVAVSTALPAVGSMCPYVKAGVGAISTQSRVNPYLAIEALALLETGLNAQQALDAVIIKDEVKELRQVGIVDAQGLAAAWSGADCKTWVGHIVGESFSVQGNMLTGADVIEAMAQTMRTTHDLSLDERLVRTLEAGQQAGGDKRGKQSAALKIHDTEDYPLLDLRVDENPYPVKELRRVLEIARLQLIPYINGLSKNGQPASVPPDEVTSMLAMPPPQRPGGGGSAPGQ